MPKDHLLFDQNHFELAAQREWADRGRRQLWCAVLIQMIRDAYSVPTGLNAGSNQAQYAKREADAFLGGNSRDFREVCEMAGVNADHMRALYLSGELAERVKPILGKRGPRGGMA